MLIALRACCPCAGTDDSTVQKITLYGPEQIADIPATLTMPETPSRPKIVLRGRITPLKAERTQPDSSMAGDTAPQPDSSMAADKAHAQLAACPEFVSVSDTTTFGDGSRAAATYKFPANTFAFWYKAAADTTTTTTITKRPVFSIVAGATAVVTPSGTIEYGAGITIGIELWGL